MPSKRSNSNADKGCVGFAYGGIMKDVRVRAFSTEDSDPTKVATDFQNHYGEINMWYVPVKDVESTFEKYLEQLNESKQRFGETHLFKLTLAEAKKALIDVTEAKKCTSFSLKKKEAKSKDDGSDDGSDDDNEEKSDNEETVKEEKPQKKDKKSKKEESEEDSEKSVKSDKKLKKKTEKKSDKKKQDSDDDKSDEDESDKSDEDDDEGKKLETKKSKAKEEPKKSKSKSK